MRSSRSRGTAATIGGVCLAVLLTGCGGDGAGEVVDDDVQPTAAETPEDETPDDDDATAALAFFRSLEATCAAHAEATGDPQVDPQRFADATTDGSTTADGHVVVEDGAGDRLAVDLDSRVVHPEAGVDEVLVRDYAFGCPEDVFLGTLDGGGEVVDPDPGTETEATSGGRDDPELLAMQALVDAWESGDREAAAEVATAEVIEMLEQVHGWAGHDADLVFVDVDGDVVEDYYACDDCSYFFETLGDSWFIGLDGDLIVSLEMGD